MPQIYIDMSRLFHLNFIWIELLWNEMHIVLRGAENYTSIYAVHEDICH